MLGSAHLSAGTSSGPKVSLSVLVAAYPRTNSAQAVTALHTLLVRLLAGERKVIHTPHVDRFSEHYKGSADKCRPTGVSWGAASVHRSSCNSCALDLQVRRRAMALHPALPARTYTDFFLRCCARVCVT